MSNPVELARLIVKTIVSEHKGKGQKRLWSPAGGKTSLVYAQLIGIHKDESLDVWIS